MNNCTGSQANSQQYPMSSRSEALSSYKALIKALVRSSRRARIAQAAEDNKRQITLLTYKKINAVRQQAQEKDAKSKIKLIPQIGALTKKIESLKNQDPAKFKKFLFYGNVSQLREALLRDAQPETLIKRMEHIRDLAGFVQNQLEYEQLVERYNPGLNMSQNENVKRTAARVGLHVPEN